EIAGAQGLPSAWVERRRSRMWQGRRDVVVALGDLILVELVLGGLECHGRDGPPGFDFRTHPMAGAAHRPSVLPGQKGRSTSSSAGAFRDLWPESRRRPVSRSTTFWRAAAAPTGRQYAVDSAADASQIIDSEP